MSKRIVIIGAGLAGTTAARELNARGQAVTVIDPQAGDTCERPPLSKHLFDDSRHHLPYHLESTEHITFVRDWAEEITLAEASADSRYTAESQRHPHPLVDHHATVGTVHLASGESIGFTHCILATGMEAHRPQIPNYPDALPVYDLGDAEWVLDRVEKAHGPFDVGVLGSGYLGMEVASSAVAAGHRATVYLRGDEPLRKQLSAPVRQALFDRHRAAGVEFVTHSSSPDDIAADVHDLFITSVGARPRLIPIDGHRPALAWDVDESLATSHRGVFAAGDCAIVTAGPYALDHPWACEPVAESHGKFLAELLGEAPDETANGTEDTPAETRCGPDGNGLEDLVRSALALEFPRPGEGVHGGADQPRRHRHDHPARPEREEVPGLPLRQHRPRGETPRCRDVQLAAHAGRRTAGTRRQSHSDESPVGGPGIRLQGSQPTVSLR